MIRFKTLCTVTFYHRYFGLNPVNGFTFIPDSATVKTLTSYGILLKEISGEFYLLSKEEETQPLFDKRLEKNSVLRFFVQYKDPYIFNYTDLELEEGESFLFSEKGFTSSTPGEVVLHSKELLGREDICRMVHRMEDLISFYKYDSKIKVEDVAAKKEIFNGTFSDFTFSFAAQELVEVGHVRISSGEAFADFIFSEATGRKSLGMLELRIDQKECLTDNKKFSIRLNSRSAFWRYNLINNEQVTVSDIKVFAGKNQVAILEEDVTLVNGVHAHAVSTSEPMLLQERYESFFELEYSKSGPVSGKKRITLPVPDVSKIKVSKTQEGRRSWCDMYIYL